jgi:chromosome segregation ATPase
MFLLFVTLQEFTLFLQIVLWIAVPVTIIALLITTILHYRRKKKNRDTVFPYPEQDNDLAVPLTGDAMPDWLASANPENLSLLKKYEREIRYFREKNHSQEEDFRRLEEKYETLLSKAYRGDKTGNENIVTDLQRETREYKQKIVELQKALEQAKEIAESDKKLQVTNEIRSENNNEPVRTAEQDYLRDMVEEEKQHISFLQQQLDQRIRSYHEMEHQLRSVSEEIEKKNQLLTEREEQLSTAEQVLEAKNMETEQHLKKIEGYLDEIGLKEETINSKTASILQLERSLEELQQHHNQSLHLLNSSNNTVTELHEQLAQQTNKTADLEERLERANRFLSKLHEEILGNLEVKEHVHSDESYA